ncbi:TonB-dependent receptor plug domain-containing protein [Agarivorans sp. QJM3NY_29]|uniref:TonB-dependent receptor plug domain-containing protein n=1 Tax=unclassified Agarivorans TaxID=2636026 RepID=UPI003D7D0408
MKLQYSACYVLGLLTASVSAVANSLSSLDLESLMDTDVQVTSAMKRAQSAFSTAASIYVLRKQDIRASGAVSVAESLKLVPGIQIRQLDSNQWAITARGVAGRYTSKLLVMVDGQSVYNPMFAGVYWEALDIPLYDIERIEVIRGQGGLLWGNNAVNGVINIITKNSIDTRTALVQVSRGDQLNYDVDMRYGDDIGNDGSYRVYGSIRDADTSKRGLDLTANDDSQQGSAGFRLDIAPSDDLSILTQFSYTHTNIGQNLKALSQEVNQNTFYQDRFKRDDLRLMARLEHRLSTRSNQMLQLSWGHQDSQQLYLNEHFKSLDIDYQMNSAFGDLQLDWGLNYRNNDLPYEENWLISNDRGIDNLRYYGAFIQAQYALVPNHLTVIFGNKLEHNSLTGWENQPAARLLWQPSEQQVVWAAVSKAVRIPSLTEFDSDSAVNGSRVADYFTTGIDAIDQYMVRTVLNGNQSVQPEKSRSYELGYRFSRHNWSFDLALFHTQSRNVIAVTPNTNSIDIDSIASLLASGQFAEAQQLLTESQVELDIVSNADLNTKGGEAVLSWRPNRRFRSEFGYSQMAYRYRLQEGTSEAIGFDSDSRQFFVKAGWQLFKQHSLFGLFRSLRSDAYRTDNFDALDVTWHWQFSPQTGLSLSGKNLLAGEHLEYRNTSETYTQPHYIDKTVVLRLSAEF